MSIDGVIKFKIEWEEKAADFPETTSIISTRQQLYSKKWIGFDQQHQVGYGNISCQTKDDKFLISGTQTGHIAEFKKEHLTEVMSYNISKNTLSCRGPVKASSESLTHAAIYSADSTVSHIIHIHHNKMWEYMLENNYLQTKEGIEYGTVEMAQEILRLFKEEDLALQQLFAMQGHHGGIFSFGEHFEQALNILFELENRFNQRLK